MPVLRLTPDYHGYTLSDPCASELIAAAHGLGMRVAFYWRLVDPRGRHWLDPGRETSGRSSNRCYLVPRTPVPRANFRRVLARPAPAIPASMTSRFSWDATGCCSWVNRKHGAATRSRHNHADALRFRTALALENAIVDRGTKRIQAQHRQVDTRFRLMQPWFKAHAAHPGVVMTKARADPSHSELSAYDTMPIIHFDSE